MQNEEDPVVVFAIRIDPVWAKYSLPNDSSYRRDLLAVLARMEAENPQRSHVEWSCDVARAHEEARRTGTMEELHRLGKAILEDSDNVTLQHQLTLLDHNERVLRYIYNRFVPPAWQMSEDYEEYEKHADGFPGWLRLPTVVEQQGEEDLLFSEFMRSSSSEGSQPDDSIKTTSVDDGQSQGPWAVSQVTVVTETCDPSLQLRASATAPEGDGSSKVETDPGTSAAPSQKD
jgi:hypothetical protein